ncbi:MAG: hypothetical protein AAF740_02975 [Bacteroidota bacterium]
MEEFLSGPAIYITYVLFAIAAIVAIAAPLVTSLINNPKSLIPGAIGVAILGILFFICVALETAPDEVQIIAGQEITPSISKNVGGSIRMMIVLLIIGVAGLVFTEVSKYFR